MEPNIVTILQKKTGLATEAMIGVVFAGSVVIEAILCPPA